MFIQAQRLLGLPVLRESGRKVGIVKDIWLDEFWKLIGVVLDRRTRPSFRKASQVIMWEQIVHCGEDALVVRDSSVVQTVEHIKLLRTFQIGVVRLKDMPVYTKEGQHLGEVADVYFQRSKGTQMIGYELTDGFLADLFEGRRRLFLPDNLTNVTLGEDAILVPASCERGPERPYAESDR